MLRELNSVYVDVNSYYLFVIADMEAIHVKEMRCAIDRMV